MVFNCPAGGEITIQYETRETRCGNVFAFLTVLLRAYSVPKITEASKVWVATFVLLPPGPIGQ